MVLEIRVCHIVEDREQTVTSESNFPRVSPISLRIDKVYNIGSVEIESMGMRFPAVRYDDGQVLVALGTRMVRRGGSLSGAQSSFTSYCTMSSSLSTVELITPEAVTVRTP